MCVCQINQYVIPSLSILGPMSTSQIQSDYPIRITFNSSSKSHTQISNPSSNGRVLWCSCGRVRWQNNKLFSSLAGQAVVSAEWDSGILKEKINPRSQPPCEEAGWVDSDGGRMCGANLPTALKLPAKALLLGRLLQKPLSLDWFLF